MVSYSTSVVRSKFTTSLCGGDRSYLAMDGVRVFFIAISTVLNCVLIDRVKVVAKSSKMASSGRKGVTSDTGTGRYWTARQPDTRHSKFDEIF